MIYHDTHTEIYIYIMIYIYITSSKDFSIFWGGVAVGESQAFGTFEPTPRLHSCLNVGLRYVYNGRMKCWPEKVTPVLHNRKQFRNDSKQKLHETSYVSMSVHTHSIQILPPCLLYIYIYIFISPYIYTIVVEIIYIYIYIIHIIIYALCIHTLHSTIPPPT